MPTRPGLAELRNGLEFQKQHLWYLYFVTKPSVMDISDTELNLRCLTTNLPKRVGETNEINIRGRKVVDPGIYNPEGTLTLTFVETSDNVVKRMIQQWEDACYDRRNTPSFGDVKADIGIELLDNTEASIYGYIIKDCFIEDSDVGELTGDSGEAIQPSITLRYNDFQRLQRI